LGELHDLRYCSIENVERVVAKHRDVICGIKIRCTANLAENGRNELDGLLLAKAAAARVGLPLVVHTPGSSLTIEQILSELKPGDVVTHCYHGRGCGLVDAERRVLPAVRAALRDGILLDVGHGVASFDFRVARSLIDQGVLPDFISSDIHHYNVHGPVFDLLTTMDKFLHLGLSLRDVILRVTQTPAHFLGREQQLGTLKVGATADITILEMQQGQFPLTDSEGHTEIAKQRLEVSHVFLAGRECGLLPRPQSV
jgi:dihydroorotase